MFELLTLDENNCEVVVKNSKSLESLIQRILVDKNPKTKKTFCDIEDISHSFKTLRYNEIKYLWETVQCKFVIWDTETKKYINNGLIRKIYYESHNNFIHMTANLFFKKPDIKKPLTGEQIRNPEKLIDIFKEIEAKRKSEIYIGSIWSKYRTSKFQKGTPNRHGKKTRLVSEQRKNIKHDLYCDEHSEYHMKKSRNHKLPFSWDLNSVKGVCRGKRDWKRTKFRKQWMKHYKSGETYRSVKEFSVDDQNFKNVLFDDWYNEQIYLSSDYYTNYYKDLNNEFEKTYAEEIEKENEQKTKRGYYEQEIINESRLEDIHNIIECFECGKKFQIDKSHYFCSESCENDYNFSNYYDSSTCHDMEVTNMTYDPNYLIWRDEVEALKKYHEFKTNLKPKTKIKITETMIPEKSNKNTINYCYECGEIFNSTEIRDGICIDCDGERAMNEADKEDSELITHEKCHKCKSYVGYDEIIYYNGVEYCSECWYEKCYFDDLSSFDIMEAEEETKAMIANDDEFDYNDSAQLIN